MRGAFRNPDKSAFAQTWINGCSRVIVIAERHAGNEQSGGAWLETQSFPKEASLDEVLNWAHKVNCNGNLIICPDESTMMEYKKVTHDN